MRKMKKILARWLNHYRRGREYAMIIQNLMIVSIFVEQFNLNRNWYFILLPGALIFFIIIGFCDKHFKMFDEDLSYRNKRNPEFTEMKNKTDKIYEKITGSRM